LGLAVKISINKKPRNFKVGANQKTLINDVAKIYLKPNEQVTFITKDFSKHDVTRKDWGFYATQSINFRLKKFFKTALVMNSSKKLFIMVVEKKYLKKFKNYCKKENQKLLIWLDEM
jgi:plastocyanin